MKPTKVTIKIGGQVVTVNNSSADDYRLNQYLNRPTMAGELFCRLGIPLPREASETTTVTVLNFE